MSRTPIKVSSAILVTLLLASSIFIRADDLTGMPYDDPKELIPASPTTVSPPPIGPLSFLPMPVWSHGTLPPTPWQLTPMGKKPVATSTTTAGTPSPLAPPKDSSAPAQDATAKVKPAPAATENPALMAVSPFLQWIKANPQAAAAQARDQANTYHAASTPDAVAPSASTPTGPTAPAADAYWLPPLIDSPTITAGGVGGSSAAIYSTPQR